MIREGKVVVVHGGVMEKGSVRIGLKDIRPHACICMYPNILSTSNEKK